MQVQSLTISDMSTLLGSGSSRDEASSNNCGNSSLREMHYDWKGYIGYYVLKDSDSKGLNNVELVDQESQKETSPRFY